MELTMRRTDADVGGNVQDLFIFFSSRERGDLNGGGDRGILSVGNGKYRI
jgi:hypothetical protein